MYFIREDPNGVDEEVVDSDGKSWQYARARIEAESPWRDDPTNDGHMHVSDSYTKESGDYKSIPEVLGN